MKKTILAILLITALAITSSSNAQVGIGVSTANINPSAQLEVSSTSKGFLPPRMTEVQKNAIISPASGLLVYQTDGVSGYYYYDGSAWKSAFEPSGQTATISAMQAQITTMQSQIAALQSQVFGLLSTVTIGTQLWTTQNLNVSNYRNGDPIPQVTDPTVWAGLTTGAWCYYNNNPANSAIYGKLYNWYAVNDSRGLVPVGFHIPTNEEWATLNTTLGADAGKKLKNSTGWLVTGLTDNGNGSNVSGFSALPAGVRYQHNGSFDNVGNETSFWSVTDSDSSIAWLLNLTGQNYTNIGMNNKGNGFSIRCIKD